MLKCLSLEFRQCKREYGFLMLAILGGFTFVGLIMGFTFVDDIAHRSFVNLAGVIFTVFTFAIIALVFGVYIRLLTTYEKNMFEKYGYLYNTLPVKSYDLVGAKVIFANIWIFLFGLIILLGCILFVIAGIIGTMIADPSILKGLSDLSKEGDLIMRQLGYALGNVGWIEFFSDFINMTFHSIVINSSIYLMFILFVTFYYTSWMQRFNKIVRYIFTFILMIGIFYAMDPLFSLQDEVLFIVVAMLGVLSFIGSCWLIDHKVDVNC